MSAPRSRWPSGPFGSESSIDNCVASPSETRTQGLHHWLLGTRTSYPRARLKMKQGRMVIANVDGSIIVTPYNQLRYDGFSKFFLGKTEVAASLATTIIRLLPDRRYRQLIATRVVPAVRPRFWAAWMLDAWHVSEPIHENSLERIKNYT